MELENLNPNVYKKSDDRKSGAADWDDKVDDPFDEREIFGTYNWIQVINRKESLGLLYLLQFYFHVQFDFGFLFEF